MPLASSTMDLVESNASRNVMREEITFLGEKLGRTIETLAGADALELVEEVRRLAWERRSETAEAVGSLQELIEEMDFDQLRVVIRAFTMFLDLANLAEDRQRIRVLRERERTAHPEFPGESIGAAIAELRQCKVTDQELRRLVESLKIDLVFTSHPTEAKRRSVRRKLRKIRELLQVCDSDQTPTERVDTEELILAEMAKLWQTDFLRPWRPSVIQEVKRGLSIKPVLWEIVPNLIGDIRKSLDESFGERAIAFHSFLRFGSWIGGDRDGHPGVTPEVTEQASVWLRQTAIELQLNVCSELFESLSLSQRQVEFGPELDSAVYAACQHWPHLEVELANIPPNEMCRRWLKVIHWRLRQTQRVTLREWSIWGAYASAAELARDVATLHDAVGKSPAAGFLRGEVQAWLDRIDTFGFHLANLDVRQDSRELSRVIDELLVSSGLCASPHDLDEASRQTLLIESMEKRLNVSSQTLRRETLDSIGLFELLHRIARAFGRHALGGHVISMTRQPSDVLSVLWLWRHTSAVSLVTTQETAAPLPIVPLFETIDDLRRGPQILNGLLEIPPI